jgi:hypothetical protein
VDEDVAVRKEGLRIVRVGCAYDFDGWKTWSSRRDGRLMCVEPCREEESWGGEEALECCWWCGTEEVAFRE